MYNIEGRRTCVNCEHDWYKLKGVEMGAMGRAYQAPMQCHFLRSDGCDVNQLVGSDGHNKALWIFNDDYNGYGNNQWNSIAHAFLAKVEDGFLTIVH